MPNTELKKKMKIFQLAKQLNISHKDIITYLKSQKIKTSINKPLDEETIKIVLSEFGKDILQNSKISTNAEFTTTLQDKKIEEDEKRIKEEAAREKAEMARQKEWRDEVESEKQKIIDDKQKIEDKKIREKAEAEAKKILDEEEKNRKKKVTSGKERTQKQTKNKPKSEEEIKEEKIKTKLKKLKEKHKHTSKRIQVSPLESRLKKLKAKKSGKDKEEKVKFSKHKRKVDLNAVDKNLKKTLATMDSGNVKKKRKRKKEEEEGIEENNVIELTEFISVNDLSKRLDVTANDVITKCIEMGMMVSINQRLDWDSIELLCAEFDFEAKKLEEYTEEVIEEVIEVDDGTWQSRPPIVSVMGHVDHGKTSILDYIRNTHVADGESGGITQHIGAYQVVLENGKKITFIDTPGHEAFTAMRARGANITDIVIIVVAADDGVMPQTKEAISHAEASGVKIIIAINKIDRPNADIEKVKRELSENRILVEEWGGKLQSVEVSAKMGTNIDKLLDAVILESEMLELKADKKGNAKGNVIESTLDKGLGAVATILIKSGTLEVGDSFICGRSYGRVRAMINDKNERLKIAYPSDTIQIQGFNNVAQAGDDFICLDDEKTVRRIASERQKIHREQEFRTKSIITLDEIGRQIAEGKTRELDIIIKGDADGSIEALADSFMKLSTKEVAVKIVYKGLGMITETDINLATASKAIIIGFHVNATAQANELSKELNVEIRNYTIIYDAVEEIRLALEGMLEPDRVHEEVGKAEVRDIIKISRLGDIAGSAVISGKMVRNSTINILRDGNVIFSGYLSSLKRFKDDAKEVKEGFECGIIVDGFNDFRVGDIVECYREKAVKRKLKSK
ncbi:MAG: translation initiation factor IF-2 [Candidatus Marinimicrobia bacterium]|nr:translation initiation factor IF-2 [Candidatus Neomarinimicrobiota bacterium]